MLNQHLLSKDKLIIMWNGTCDICSISLLTSVCNYGLSVCTYSLVCRSGMSCHTMPSAQVWVQNPGLAKPRTRVVGSREPYEYWGSGHRFGKTYSNCIVAQVLENCIHAPLLAFCVRGRWWVSAESRHLWPGALHTTLYYYNYKCFCI